MEYLIRGNTFKIKDELQSHGCVSIYEDGKFKHWKTPELEKDELSYKKLRSITKAFNTYMDPIKLSPECQMIQDCLGKG